MYRITPIVALACLLCLPVADPLSPTASAQWVQEGIYWHYYPNTDDMPGECFGHCGAGCSNTLNPCSPKGRWSMTFVWGPTFTGRIGDSEECQPQWLDDSQYPERWYGWWYVDYFDAYEAEARFTWSGVYSDFCARHDRSCWSNPVYCLLPVDAHLACNRSSPRSWSYTRYIVGSTNTERQYLYSGYCS